jgi:hypothetical protein
MRRATSLLALIACSLAPRADAQRFEDVAPGSRVRIAVADSLRQEPFLPRTRSFIGTLARATADTLWLHVAGPDTIRVPRSTLRGMEISRGASRGSSALEQGLAVALIFGIPLYAAADDRDERQRAIAIVGSTAVVAAVVGALRPYERWRRVR